MKRAYFLPLALLAVMFACSLWNAKIMESKTQHWRQQLEHTDQLAQQDNWRDAESALLESYHSWNSAQTYLRIVSHHNLVDEAEALYHRAQAFASQQDLAEFRATVSDLLTQFQLLAEMERFTAQNVM